MTLGSWGEAWETKPGSPARTRQLTSQVKEEITCDNW